MMVYEFAKYPDETVEKGAHLFFKYAREGRIQSAESLIKNQYKIITLCGSIKFKDESSRKTYIRWKYSFNT